MSLKPAGLAERRPLPKRKQLPSIVSQLARFHHRQRKAVCDIAGRHPRLADLARSFPALLFSLAVRRSNTDAGGIIQAVIDGRPLAEVAAMARLPLWTRRLPPEAFQNPVPLLPDGDMFRRQIVNHLPRKPWHLQRWLWTVAVAGYWGGDDLAVWCARHLVEKNQCADTIPTALLSLWAWHSLRPDNEASKLITTRWQPHLGYDAALAATNDWMDEVGTSLVPKPQDKSLDYLASGECDGYEFLRIESKSGLAQEAEALRNCLRDYSLDPPGCGDSIFSIRRQGQRVAALCVRHDHYTPLPHISELKARDNDEAPREVWIAAAKWLCNHDLTRLTMLAPAPGKEPLNVGHWRKLWLPYWKDRKYRPYWLPITPHAGWQWRLENVR